MITSFIARLQVLTLSILLIISGVCFANKPLKNLFDKGISLTRDGKFRQAQDQFRKALKLDPFYYPAKAQLRVTEDILAGRFSHKAAILMIDGLVYVKSGKIKLGIKNYNKSLKIHPGYAPTYNFRGLAYTSGKKYGKAHRDFNKALSLEPRYVSAWNNRAINYYEQGQYKAAAADCTRAIKIDPGQPIVFNNRGIAFYHLGKYQLAIRDFTRAIRINPRYAKAYNARGTTWFQGLKNRKKGCADWKKACELGYCGTYNNALLTDRCH